MKLNGLGLLCLLLVAEGSQAAGFALGEQNASGLGNAFAGQAAAAGDASTIFFNPAGMTLLDGRQFSLSADYVAPSARFSGTATPALSSATGGDAARSATIPAFYYSMDLRPGLKFGLGVTVPFGLSTEYDFPWAGETQALKSKLETLDVNPALAWAVNDRLSLGLGVSWQRIDAELTSYNPYLPGVVSMSGDDTGWGWNAGALYKIDEGTRVGLSYRSKIDYRLTGTLSPSASPAAYADITTPDTASLALFKRLNAKWDVLADLTWTGWSSFQELSVNGANGSSILTIPEHWKDTMRYSLGFNYHAGERFTWRFGVSYDETPIPDPQYRTPRIPDQNRTMVAFGGRYRLSGQTALDFGYAHLFINDAAIHHADSGVTLDGTYTDSADIFGLQINHRF
ncbi:MAG TPA: porin [Parasulfuritortus sp.]